MQLNFKGQTAIVTGACGGMGLEVSKNLSSNNINLLMLDLKKPPKEIASSTPSCSDFGPQTRPKINPQSTKQ